MTLIGHVSLYALTVVIPQSVWSSLASFPVLYIGPDQILPLTSVLGGIIGVLLMFWHRAVSLSGRLWRFVVRR